jgi:hypothetical protein
MSAENSIRIFLSCFGIYAALYGPPWLIVVPMLLLSLRFRAWEVIALGLLADFLWLPGIHLPLFLIAGIAIVWAFEPLRKELLIS